jgi:hypothetical protein
MGVAATERAIQRRTKAAQRIADLQTRFRHTGGRGGEGLVRHKRRAE